MDEQMLLHNIRQAKSSVADTGIPTSMPKSLLPLGALLKTRMLLTARFSSCCQVLPVTVDILTGPFFSGEFPLPARFLVSLLEEAMSRKCSSATSYVCQPSFLPQHD
eukprot:1155803-Pelagomonas_calceolata.AAC.4